jgi:hypothetical protein
MSGEDWIKGLARVAREERDAGAGTAIHPDLSRPIDEATRARFADAALRAMGPAPLARAPAARARPRVAYVGAAAVGVAALAAGALLLVRSPRTALVPSYEVSFVGGSSETRAVPSSSAGESVEVHADGYLEIRLRPARPVQQQLEVQTTALHDGKLLPWTPRVETSSDGALRISGPVATLFPDARGSWAVLVAIGQAGTVPRDPDSIARAAREPRDSVQVVRAAVTIRP